MSAAEVFTTVLNQSVRDARIRFRVEGQEITAGKAFDSERCRADITVRVNHPRFFSRVIASGNLGLGEAYMNREFDMEEGELQDFLLVLLRNRLDRTLRLSPATAARVLWVRFVDTMRGKPVNVQRHYDLGDDLFKTFLDSNLVYSCGYVKDNAEDLEAIQVNKLDRICKKLRLKAGEKLLDIGCGYGGLLIYAAKHYGVTGEGVTLSHGHCNHANERIKEEELTGRVKIRYCDFTGISETYDKVVSVGMMEHVPRREYSRYFRTISRVLKAEGLALVHTLGANAPKNRHDPFFQRYIFPNSNQPKLSEIAHNAEQTGLAILDVENLIRHYAHTVLGWQKRFRENSATLARSRYDNRFIRMWEYYLACGVAAALASDSALYQVLLAKDYAAPIPLHRV